MAFMYALNDKLHVARGAIEKLTPNGFLYRCAASDAYAPLSMGAPVVLTSGEAAVGLTGTEKRMQFVAATELGCPKESYYVRGAWNLSYVASAFLRDRQLAKEKYAARTYPEWWLAQIEVQLQFNSISLFPQRSEFKISDARSGGSLLEFELEGRTLSAYKVRVY